MRTALEQAGVTGHAHPGVSVVNDVRAIRTGQGRPYTVFTPFYRNWERVSRRPVLDAPKRIDMPATIRPGRVPSLASLGLEQEVAEPAPGGERAGLTRLAEFLDGAVADYDSGRDQAGTDGSSRLSPYLRFGCLSPRAVEDQLPGGIGDGAAGGEAQGPAAQGPAAQGPAAQGPARLRAPSGSGLSGSGLSGSGLSGSGFSGSGFSRAAPPALLA